MATVICAAIFHPDKRPHVGYRYIIQYLNIICNRKEGRAEGLEEGLEKGCEKGLALLSNLINQLLSLGRNDEIARVTTDEAYRNTLLKEFNLTLDA